MPAIIVTESPLALPFVTDRGLCIPRSLDGVYARPTRGTEHGYAPCSEAEDCRGRCVCASAERKANERETAFPLVTVSVLLHVARSIRLRLLTAGPEPDPASGNSLTRQHREARPRATIGTVKEPMESKMAERIELTNPQGMGMTADGFLEVRGEVNGKPTTFAIPAKAAPYLIVGLAQAAEDYAQVTRSDQDRPVFHLVELQVQRLVTRDGAFLVLKLKGGIQLTVHATIDQLEEMGSSILDKAEQMRTAPPLTRQ